MASNPDDGLPNKHTIYVASSGGGKTQAMAANVAKQNPKRSIIWDTHGSFRGQVVKTILEFGRALEKNYDNKAFCICYQGKGGADNFGKFCAMVWEFTQGTMPTYLVLDEVADSSGSIAKDSTAFGEIMRGGRKYGLIVHATAVSASEIPKTLWRECLTKWLGMQDNEPDIVRAKKVLMTATIEELQSLQAMNFLVKTPDNKVDRALIKYKKPPHRI